MEAFVEKLKKTFKGDIASDEETLIQYSYDASLFTIKPKLVVFPKNTEDIKTVVCLVRDENTAGAHWSLTARSAGTDMSGGSLTDSIVVEMTRYFNHIKEIGAGYAIVEPGVYYRDFEKETLKHHLLLPTYPASREICTVGGMVANNSGGEKTLTYGKTEQYIDTLTMVLADGSECTFQPITMEALKEKEKLDSSEGEIYRRMSRLVNAHYDALQQARPRVSKNSAGYYLWNIFDKEHKIFDLTKLIVGSQGTLGIITEIKFRLIKPKTHSRLLVVFLTDTAILGNLINHLLIYKPESLESYDDHTFSVALKVFPEIAERLGGNIITLAFKFLPEFWAVLTGGIPKMVILAEFTGDSDADAAQKAYAAEKNLKEFNCKTRVTASPDEAQKYWVIRRESFNLLRHHVRGLRTAPFIDDMVVRPDQLQVFLPRLYAILDEYKLLYTVAGHPGDGNFHIIPLMDLTNLESKKIIAELSNRVYKLVFEFHGSITGEHNDGLVRSPYLQTMYGTTIYHLFEETKQIFDPQGIFNPGKKVGASMSYSMDHINNETPQTSP